MKFAVTKRLLGLNIENIKLSVLNLNKINEWL